MLFILLSKVSFYRTRCWNASVVLPVLLFNYDLFANFALLKYVSGLFSIGESEPCRPSLQVCCCSELCYFRLCEYMGPWQGLPDFWGNWFFFWIDPWYPFIQCFDVCIWKAQEGGSSYEWILPLFLSFYASMYLLVQALFRYTCTHTNTHVMHVHSSFMWVSSHFVSHVMHVILVLLIIYLVKIPKVSWLDHWSNICWRGKTNFGKFPGTNSFFPFISKFGWGFVSDCVRSRQQPCTFRAHIYAWVTAL